MNISLPTLLPFLILPTTLMQVLSDKNTGSSWLMISHLTTVWSYDGAPNGIYNRVLNSDCCPPPWLHDYILGPWQLDCIYACFQCLSHVTAIYHVFAENQHLLLFFFWQKHLVVNNRFT